ncbi:MAG: urease subunit beta [Alistipes senegalensis]|nr:urease subunit beta [Bacteroides cellulosilyticus]MCM1351926.1 urease subunit beta [Alistipes senegalensis]
METTNHNTANDASQPTSLYPNRPGFRPEQPVAVGGVLLLPDPIAYNEGRKTVKLTVRNTGDRPIQVGSHFHFFEVNRYLEFDREASFGCHLNIPATTAVRFEPGDQKEVEVVAYAGKRRIIGFNGLVMGYTGDEDAPSYYPARTQAMQNMRSSGFKTTGGKTAPKEGAANEPKQQPKAAPAANNSTNTHKQ